MQLKCILESILFVHGEPIETAVLTELTGRSEDEVTAALSELEREYQTRGFALLKKDGAYQLGTNPENTGYIDQLVKNQFSQELSRSALETLAVIAYKGPVTRPQIEYLRGVNSAFTVRTLLMRGLIQRIENPKDARSFLYRVSFDFLKHMGLTGMEELPRFEEFRKKEMEDEESKNASTSHVQNE